MENEEEKVGDLVKKKIGSFSNFAKVSLSYWAVSFITRASSEALKTNFLTNSTFFVDLGSFPHSFPSYSLKRHFIFPKVKYGSNAVNFIYQTG